MLKMSTRGSRTLVVDGEFLPVPFGADVPFQTGWAEMSGNFQATNQEMRIRRSVHHGSKEIMSDQISNEAPVQAYRQAGIAALAVLVLTAFHHAYGAIAYDTPWRFHVAIVAPVVGLAITCALYLGSSRRGTPSGKMWTRIAVALILIFPAGLIGVVEGGYNHLIKNLVYFLSGAETARTLFPPPAYELPDNFLFETTGVLQFPLGLAAAYLSLVLLRRSQAAA